MKTKKFYFYGALFSVFLIPSLASAIAIDIPQFKSVLDGKIYRGSRPGDAGLHELMQLKINTDVDLQGGDYFGDLFSDAGESPTDIAEENRAAVANHLRFLNFPMSSLNPDFDDQDTMIAKILDTISDPAMQPVYFHCFHGEDLSGIIAALYRVVYQGCSIAQAHLEMKQDGHSPFMPWIDWYLENDSKKFSAPDSRKSACPLPK